MSEEETNAELERLQQTITLTLQEIDKNYAESNQIIISKILPEIDNYAQATHSIWERSKTWLYFFNSLDQAPPATVISDHHSETSATNRPPFGDVGVSPAESNTSWQRLNHDVTMKDITELGSVSGKIRSSLQHRTLGMTADYTHKMTDLADGYSTGSSTLSDVRRRQFDSPPRTMPFRTSPSDLVGTPAKEAARILTEDVLRTIDSSGSSSAHSARADKWNMNSLDQEQPGDRERFESFLDVRERRFKHMSQNEELPALNVTAKSPGLPENNRPAWLRVDKSLVSTPTVERVLDTRGRDLRMLKKPEEAYEDVYGSDDDMLITQEIHDLNTNEDKSMNSADTFMNFLPKDHSDNESIRAYQFDDPFNDHPVHEHSHHGDNASESTITMVMGQTEKIPARFSLHYFPQEFQCPPGSTDLTLLYTIFNERPGMMLTHEQVLAYLNDPSYTKERVALLTNLLERKKFLKRVGESNSWTIRR